MARLVNTINAQLRRALPGYCAFCLGPVRGDHPWCEGCLVEMPWNTSACWRCAEPLPSVAGGDRTLCGRCLKRPPAQVRSLAPWRYEGRMVRLVQRYKFGAEAWAGEVMIQLMVVALANAALRVDAVIGVPGHRERTRQQGFDHVAWLTRRLAGRLELPLIEARRRRETPSQRGLDRQHRRRNLRGAFALSQALPKRVMIIDDVMTTGATLDALARACLDAGAEEVVALAFARTPPGGI
ncbi:ComF family protein [Salinicola avicenniae]|uniref:ComF family protein n=1 Tax=Salinicola avicenniae TaxID=2916836 RepID=UPI002073BD34|nr:ComF family protein [Salinicola sp. S1-1-8]